MNTQGLRNLAFKFRHAFRGFPTCIDGVNFRIDESLRRFDAQSELCVHQVMRKFLSQGDVFIDVGANFGLHSILGAHLVGASGKVIAVEPVPANLALLRRNLQLNGFNDRCRIVPRAVTADGKGSVSMVSEPGLSLTARIGSIGSAGEHDIPAVTLDQCFAGMDRAPDLVKIDVEGAERMVLEGASQLLEAEVPLLIEVHPSGLLAYGSSHEELTDFLDSHGYREQRVAEIESRGVVTIHSLYVTSA